MKNIGWIRISDIYIWLVTSCISIVAVAKKKLCEYETDDKIDDIFRQLLLSKIVTLTQQKRNWSESFTELNFIE